MGFAEGDDDGLTKFELTKKGELADEGMNRCRKLLGKQKTLNDYFFCDGSIDGFEECKKYSKFSHFGNRLEELHLEERAEISNSSLKYEILRERLGIYDKDAKTNYAEVWKLKGIRTQIEFVYERLKLYRGLRQMADEIQAKNQIVNYVQSSLILPGFGS